MRRMSPPPPLLLAGLLAMLTTLTACAPGARVQRVSEEEIRAEAQLHKRLALESEMARRQRLFDVVYRLGRAAAQECGGGRPLSGLELGGLALFQKVHRPMAEELGFDDRPRITAVAADSPAARAGVRAGDYLTALNGRPLGKGKDAYRDAGFELRDALEEGSARLTLATSAGVREVKLVPERGCPSDLFITRETLPTPKANGKAILMPVSFLRSARRDDELAAIVAFLLAYNVRGLAESSQQGSLLTTRRNFFALAGEDETNLYQPPQSLDALGVKEADRQAVVWLQRAGYDPRQALTFWRRYLAATPALAEDVMWGKHLLGAPRLVRMAETASATP